MRVEGWRYLIWSPLYMLFSIFEWPHRCRISMVSIMIFRLLTAVSLVNPFSIFLLLSSHLVNATFKAKIYYSFPLFDLWSPAYLKIITCIHSITPPAIQNFLGFFPLPSNCSAKFLPSSIQPFHPPFSILCPPSYCSPRSIPSPISHSPPQSLSFRLKLNWISFVGDLVRLHCGPPCQ